MSGAQKFLFDHSFDEPDLEALQQVIRQEAFEEGRRAGVVEANTANAILAQNLLTQMEFLKQQELEHSQKIEEEVASVARVIFQTVFPVANQNHGFDEVLEMVKKACADFRQDDVHQATIFVAPSAVDSLVGCIKEIETTIVLNVQADPLFGPGDCRIDWGKSGIERLSRHIYDQVILALARGGACDVNIEENKSIDQDAPLEGSPQEEQEPGSET